MADARVRVIIDAEDRTKGAFGSVTSSIRSFRRDLSLITFGIAAFIGSMAILAKQTEEGSKAVNRFGDATKGLGKEMGEVTKPATVTFFKALTTAVNELTAGFEELRAITRKEGFLEGFLIPTLAGRPFQKATPLEMAAFRGIPLERIEEVVGRRVPRPGEGPRRPKAPFPREVLDVIGGLRERPFGVGLSLREQEEGRAALAEVRAETSRVEAEREESAKRAIKEQQEEERKLLEDVRDLIDPERARLRLMERQLQALNDIGQAGTEIHRNLQLAIVSEERRLTLLKAETAERMAQAAQEAEMWRMQNISTGPIGREMFQTSERWQALQIAQAAGLSPAQIAAIMGSIQMGVGMGQSAVDAITGILEGARRGPVSVNGVTINISGVPVDDARKVAAAVGDAVSRAQRTS